jgi:ligand-binding sensor domain-containing protein
VGIASGRVQRFLALRIVLAGMLLACRCTFALDPSLDISQYAHTSWKVRDGFTKGVITSLAQTPDGYVWLGTESGLLRFDGVRPVQWQPPAGQQLPGSLITFLLAAHDGTLWIGTANSEQIRNWLARA